MALRDTEAANTSLPASLIPDPVGTTWAPLFLNTDDDMVDSLESEIESPRVLISTDSFGANLSDIPECSRSSIEESQTQDLSPDRQAAADRNKLAKRLVETEHALREERYFADQELAKLQADAKHSETASAFQIEQLLGKLRKLEVLNQEFELQVKAWMDKALLEASLRTKTEHQLGELQLKYNEHMQNWEAHGTKLVESRDLVIVERDSLRRELESVRAKREIAELKTADYKGLYEIEAGSAVKFEAEAVCLQKQLAQAQAARTNLLSCINSDSFASTEHTDDNANWLQLVRITADNTALNERVHRMQSDLAQAHSKLAASQAKAEGLSKENEALTAEKKIAFGKRDGTGEAERELLDFIQSWCPELAFVRLAQGRFTIADLKISTFMRNKAAVIAVEGPLTLLSPVANFVKKKKANEPSPFPSNIPAKLKGHRRTQSSGMCDQFILESENDFTLNLGVLQSSLNQASTGIRSLKEITKSRDISPNTVLQSVGSKVSSRHSTPFRAPLREQNMKKAQKGKIPFK